MMTREMRDRAVAVMNDVVAQLDAAENPLAVAPGNYITLPDGVEGFHRDADLRDALPVVQAECEVCMLGAAVLSKARLYDGVPLWSLFGDDFDKSADGDQCRDALRDVFDDETADLVESAFEKCAATEATGPLDRFYGAAAFGRRFTDPRSRARAIAENVIANDGLFVVESMTKTRYYEERTRKHKRGAAS